MHKNIIIAPKIVRALNADEPTVALESTVITHGLPHPQNVTLAKEMETEVERHGAIPATIALMDGEIRVGLTAQEIARIADAESPQKVSVRDFGPVVARGGTGGTTVAATAFAAHKVGIKVFATGGIGGVHRDHSFDISADLGQLAKTPLIVVSAGVKAILDLPATLEYLETAGVVVVGYKTEVFPAFYSLDSGLPAPHTVDSPQEVASIAKAHWGLGIRSAILVAVPPPADEALPAEVVEEAIKKALEEANKNGIRGQGVTPFLLTRVSELTNKDSLKANLALLKNNARIAAKIAGAMTMGRKMGLL